MSAGGWPGGHAGASGEGAVGRRRGSMKQRRFRHWSPYHPRQTTAELAAVEMAEGVDDITDTTPYSAIEHGIVVSFVVRPPWEIVRGTCSG